MDICLHVCLAKIRTLEYLDQTMDPDQSLFSCQSGGEVFLDWDNFFFIFIRSAPFGRFRYPPPQKKQLCV